MKDLVESGFHNPRIYGAASATKEVSPYRDTKMPKKRGQERGNYAVRTYDPVQTNDFIHA